jgi:hypothetical protein
LARWPPFRPAAAMTVARSVADILTDHVVFEINHFYVYAVDVDFDPLF